MTASAHHPAAKPRLGRRRRGCSMMASARQPAAQPRPGRRRQMDAMTASARRPAAQLTFATKTDDDTECQLVASLVHTPSFSLYRFVVSRTSRAEHICPFPLVSSKPGWPKLSRCRARVDRNARRPPAARRPRRPLSLRELVLEASKRLIRS